MGLEDIKRKLADMTADISNVQTAITETSEASDSLTQKIAGLASANTKAGSVWSVIGRMSSGSGLYDIQNKTRSIAFLFKVKQNFDKDRIKNENRINEILSNGIKRREKLLSITKLANSNNMDALIKGKLLHDDTLKLQMKQYGFAEAISKEAFRANKALKESVLSEASTLDSREYGKRSDKSDLFKKLGGVAGGNLADRQDLAVGIDSKTDELNEQLSNLTQLRKDFEQEKLTREEYEAALQENYDKKERVKQLKADLIKEEKREMEASITDLILAEKLKLLTKEQDAVSEAKKTIENNKKVVTEMMKAQHEARMAYEKSEAENHGFADSRLKQDKEYTDIQLGLAKEAVEQARQSLKNREKEEERVNAEFDVLTLKRRAEQEKRDKFEAEKQYNLDWYEAQIINNKELTLAKEQELKDELSAQKEIQAVITGELQQSQELIDAYNSELRILIENAEDSGLVTVNTIEDADGNITSTETVKGKKNKPKFVNPRDKRTGIKRIFGMQSDAKNQQGGLLSKIYGKEAEDRALRNAEEGTKPDSVKLLKTIGDKFGLDKRKLSNIFKFAKVGFMVFGKVLLFVSLLGMLVFVMRKSGVFEKIGLMYDKFVGEGLLDDAIHHFTSIFGGIFDMVFGTFELLSALFAGDMGGAGEALIKIGLGLWGVVQGSLGLMFTGFITLFRIILGGIISSAVSRVSRNLRLIRDEGMRGAVKVAYNFAEWLVKRLLLTAIATAVGAAIGFFFGGPPGAILGAKAGGIVGSLASAMETGGVTHKAGNYLVGEKGPEIISLPGNTKVHNNKDSNRMLGNNINVTVQGRVGASDQELNEIARKIGQKVSLEMNRYSNSGYRG